MITKKEAKRNASGKERTAQKKKTSVQAAQVREASMQEEQVQQASAEAVEAGVHTYGRDEDWVRPTDPAVLEHLEWFRDQKLGLFMHWGLYSQLGMMESWGLCDSDSDWTYGCWDWNDPKECQKQYKALNRSFNPIRLQPQVWAKTAKACGFRYAILTSKHHDGFCLWDTKESDYRVTAPECPFSTHEYADLYKHVFNAFRAEGLGTVAYFSKADWHSPDYWAPDRNVGGPTSRGANYDTAAEPERWERFVRYTQAQMLDLVENYGPLDVLWLDAGWVNPREKEDLRLHEVAEKARRITPGLLFADRTVGGPFENILTPEHAIPPMPMTSPWESCLVLDDNGWGHSFDHKYKSARTIAHLFIEIVAKGGNLALGVGPQPDGRLAPEAVRILMTLGQWLEKNGEAIYGTRVHEPHGKNGWFFTRKGAVRYALLPRQAGDPTCGDLVIPLPASCGHFQRVTRLQDDRDIPFRQTDAGLLLCVPPIPGETEAPFALGFRLD
jgi:alpha-L-fucosidase